METWKDVPGYEGFYEVSTNGNVRRFGKNKNLKPIENNRGYTSVHLCKDNARKKHRVNRLVAMAFIANEGKLPQVNHIDENKANNNVENLEWCDPKYNSNHGTRNKRISVSVLCKETGMVFPSTVTAADWAGTFPSCISRCCRGGRKSAGGYRWEYVKGGS